MSAALSRCLRITASAATLSTEERNKAGKYTHMHNPQAFRLKIVRTMILILFSFFAYNLSIRRHLLHVISS
ncbi:hypothetical protein JNB88_29925 [Rhizobium cauense]|nr:hypothetical protein [Rhizobium cauense]